MTNWISYDQRIDELGSFKDEISQWVHLIEDDIPTQLGASCENTPDDWESVIEDAPKEKQLSLVKAMACKDCIRRVISRYGHLLALKTNQYEQLLENYAERGAYIKRFNDLAWRSKRIKPLGVERSEPEAGPMAIDRSDEVILKKIKEKNQDMIAHVIAQLDAEEEARGKKEEAEAPPEGSVVDPEDDSEVET